LHRVGIENKNTLIVTVKGFLFNIAKALNPKQMKTSYPIILLILIGFGNLAYGQNVNIPDANFKNYLVNNVSINTNGDNEIQVSEAAAFTGTLYSHNLNILTLQALKLSLL